MNPIVRDEENPSHVSYGNYHINTYIKKNKIPQDQRDILKNMWKQTASFSVQL